MTIRESKLIEMAKATAPNLRAFLKKFPIFAELQANHKSPEDKKNWEELKDFFWALYPDYKDEGNKSPSKAFTDSIYPILKKN